jgi:electron transfer flavoprotein alpha subunit
VLDLLGSGEVHLLVVGQQAADAAIAATKVSGVASVIYAEGEFLAHGFIDNIAAQVLSIARHCSYPHYTLSLRRLQCGVQ